MHSDTRFWDGIAERYSEKPLPNPDSTERKLAEIRACMRPGARLLDLGCGTGTIGIALAPQAKQVHCVDLSEEMLRIGRGRAAEAQVDNVDFHCAADVAGLTAFEEGSLDGILAFNLLHLTPRWREVITQAHVRLAPDGFFATSTACLADSWVPYRPLLRAMRWLGKAPTVVMLGKADLITAMRAESFAQIREPDVGANRQTAFLIAHKAP